MLQLFIRFYVQSVALIYIVGAWMYLSLQRLDYNALAIYTYTPRTSVRITCGIQPTY